LLHSNLAFPLLQKLSEAGDPIATTRFKEEIALRFEEGHFNTLVYLVAMEYLIYLNEEERATLFSVIEENICAFFERCLTDPTHIGTAINLLVQFNYPAPLNKIYTAHYSEIGAEIPIKEVHTYLSIIPLMDTTEDLFGFVRKHYSEIYEIVLSQYREFFHTLPESDLHSLHMLYDLCYLLLRDSKYLHYLPLDKTWVEEELVDYYSPRECEFFLEFKHYGLVEECEVVNISNGLRKDFIREFYPNFFLSANFRELSKILLKNETMVITEMSYKVPELPEMKDEIVVEFIKMDTSKKNKVFKDMHTKIVKLWNSEKSSLQDILREYATLLKHKKDKTDQILILFMLCVEFLDTVYHFRYIEQEDFRFRLIRYFERKGFEIKCEFTTNQEFFTTFQVKSKTSHKWHSVLYSFEGYLYPLEVFLDLVSDIFFPSQNVRVRLMRLYGDDIELLLDTRGGLTREEWISMEEHFFKKNP